MNQVFEINVDKSQMIYVLVFILLPDCSRGYFGEECAGKCSDKCYGCNNINGVCVTLDVDQDGGEITVMKV